MRLQYIKILNILFIPTRTQQNVQLKSSYSIILDYRTVSFNKLLYENFLVEFKLTEVNI